MLAGLLVLVAGGELLLKGAVGLARSFGLTPAVIGLTIVAAGTSVPELAVSAVAAWEGKTDITIGNVVGSNIFNIAFILGGVSVYRNLIITGNTIKLEYPVLLVVTILCAVLTFDNAISRQEAGLFLLIYILFTYFMIRIVKNQLSEKEKGSFTQEAEEIAEPSPPFTKSALFTVIGIGLLGYGADLTVKGAITFGQLVGLSERVIGLTIVGAGTGLPEVVTSFVSAYRGRNDIAIANVIGSNLFNLLCILGISSLISPLSVPAEIVKWDNLWMVGLTFLMFPLMHFGLSISRKDGFVLLAFYIVYLATLF